MPCQAMGLSSFGFGGTNTHARLGQEGANALAVSILASHAWVGAAKMLDNSCEVADDVSIVGGVLQHSNRGQRLML